MQHNRQLYKQFIIDKNFQFSFLKYFILLGFTQIAVQLFLIVFFKNNFQQMLLQIGKNETDPIMVFLDRQSQFLLNVSMASSSIFLIVLILMGLYLSQKIAGPIRKTINYLNDNKSFDLSFRQNDYFKELASAINKYKEKKN